MPMRNKNIIKSQNIAALEPVILRLLPSGNPTIDKVAQLRGLSVRTLQRRLHDAGISYSELVEEVRYEMACDLLDSSEMRLAAIAKILGYKDPSSFSRAFKRWKAISPLNYRKSHHA